MNSRQNPGPVPVSDSRSGGSGSGSGEREAPMVLALPPWLLSWVGRALIVIWLAGLVVVFVSGWRVDDPFAARIARGFLFALLFMMMIVSGRVRQLASGKIPVPSRYDMRLNGFYFAGFMFLFTAIWSNLSWDQPRVGWALLIVGGVLLGVAGVLYLKEQKRKKSVPAEIEVPIAERAVSTPLGERVIRIGQPQPARGGWVAWWSVKGLPSGYLLQPAFGPDSMTSLAAALMAAESAATTPVRP